MYNTLALQRGGRLLSTVYPHGREYPFLPRTCGILTCSAPGCSSHASGFGFTSDIQLPGNRRYEEQVECIIVSALTVRVIRFVCVVTLKFDGVIYSDNARLCCLTHGGCRQRTNGDTVNRMFDDIKLIHVGIQAKFATSL